MTHSGPYYAHDLEGLLRLELAQIAERNDPQEDLAATLANLIRACYAIPRTDPLKNTRSVPKRWRPAIRPILTDPKARPSGKCATCGNEPRILLYRRPGTRKGRASICRTCYRTRPDLDKEKH